jgi:hypothetical protein
LPSGVERYVLEGAATRVFGRWLVVGDDHEERGLDRAVSTPRSSAMVASPMLTLSALGVRFQAIQQRQLVNQRSPTGGLAPT